MPILNLCIPVPLQVQCLIKAVISRDNPTLMCFEVMLTALGTKIQYFAVAFEINIITEIRYNAGLWGMCRISSLPKPSLR